MYQWRRRRFFSPAIIIALLLTTNLILIQRSQQEEQSDDHHTSETSTSGISPSFSKYRLIQARLLKEEVLHSSHFPGRRVKRHIPLDKGVEDDGLPLQKLRLELPLDDEDSPMKVIHLTLNKDLIPQGYFERINGTEGGSENVRKPKYEDVDLCHYQGKVQGQPQSYAAVSTCDGQLRGVIFDGEEMHYLEPSSFSTPWKVLHYRSSHFIEEEDGKKKKKNETHQDHEDCGNEIHPPEEEEKEGQPHSRRTKRGAASHTDLRMPYNSNGKSRYVELVVVVDNLKFREVGDMKKVLRHVKDIANIVNALYQPFNIFVALVGVVVWKERDEIDIAKEGDTTLNSFLQYRKERLLRHHPNDNAQLLTAKEFDNGVVGKAMQGPMCSYKYSGGVNSDRKDSPVGIVATTVAHEMGHNFGLSHDSEECHCPAPGNRCVMAASASSNRTFHWSSCSIKDMAYAFDHGMDYCLRNQPKSLYEGPVCGNGFTEPGEECDCGLPEHCDNPCCDAETCMMHSNATCASGTCCDMLTCHVKEAGTPCREKTGLCDLPEYCTGSTEFCPEDVKMLDGIECKTPNGKAYCYSGECRTHTDQCKLLWGPSGNNSDDLCYNRNTNGSRVAHCGYDLVADKYSQCRPLDVKCGVLHCQMNTEKLEYGYESAALLASFFVNSGGKIHPCRSVVVDFGLSDVNPGMVPDGAQCGNGKMCVSQKCVDVMDTGRAGLLDQCGGVNDHCSGHGKCNSKGHCHCDDGYGGTLCEGPGYGGSVDSGPAYHSSSSKLLKALKVTIFGFIPLIAIITFYLYYSNGSLKKICLELRRGGLQAVANPPLSRITSPGGSPPPKPPPPSNGGVMGNGHINSNSSPPSGPQSPLGDTTDFFGKYKGFTLAPRADSVSSNTTTVNNNVHSTITTQQPQSILAKPEISSNSPSSLRRKIDSVLVKTSDRPATLNTKVNGTCSNGSSSSSSRGVSVSWAHPIEHRLSPTTGAGGVDSEDSAGSDTPLYETQNSSQTSQKQEESSHPATPRLLKKEPSFSGLTSRLTAALRSISLRRSNSSLQSKELENYRRKLEISKPILHSDSVDGPKEKMILQGQSIQPIEPRYVNIPLADADSGSSPEEGRKPSGPPPVQIQKPALKSVQRMRDDGAPPPPNPKKVQRAHSMIHQTSGGGGSNRNSLPSAYSSLKRPSGPPPKPPGPPPLPPDNKGLERRDTTPPRTTFFTKSSTPPPYNPNKSSLTSSSARFNFVTRPTLGSSDWLRSKLQQQNQNQQNNSSSASESSTDSGISSTSSSSTGGYVSPFASAGRGNFRSIFGVGSGTSTKLPKESPSKDREDNIYDTIDEGISTPHLASSEESEEGSSPQTKPESSPSTTTGLDDKVETLSTGSSEGGANGLLSEIISEIKCRNRESIYNSIDRRKQKAARKQQLIEQANREMEKSNNRDPSPSSRSATKPPGTGTSIFDMTKPLPREPTPPKPSASYKPSITRDFRSSTPPKNSGTSSRESTPPRDTCTPPLRPSIFSSSYQKPLSREGTPPRPPDPSCKSSIYSPPKPMCAVNGIPKLHDTLNPDKPETPSSSSSFPAYTKPNPPTFTSTSGSMKNCSSNTTPTPLKSSSSSSSTKPTIPEKPSNIISSSSTLPLPLRPPPAVPLSPIYMARISHNNKNNKTENNRKPLSSLPKPSSQDPKEIVYAPAGILLDGDGELNQHHLSTIRRGARTPSKKNLYFKDNSDENDFGGEEDSSTKSSVPTQQMFIKKPGGGGIYASLRKVSVPVVVRRDSLEKEKAETRANSNFIFNNSDTTSSNDLIIGGNNKEGKAILLDSTTSTPNSCRQTPVTFSTFGRSTRNGNIHKQNGNS